MSAASHQPHLEKAAHRTLERRTTGRVDIIFGPMFAGKSSELLQRVKALEVCLAAQADGQCQVDLADSAVSTAVAAGR